jgi:hypothetical protein
MKYFHFLKTLSNSLRSFGSLDESDAVESLQKELAAKVKGINPEKPEAVMNPLELAVFETGKYGLLEDDYNIKPEHVSKVIRHSHLENSIESALAISDALLLGEGKILSSVGKYFVSIDGNIYGCDGSMSEADESFEDVSDQSYDKDLVKSIVRKIEKTERSLE